MTDDTSLTATRELDKYAAALRSIEPSQALDLRMNEAIEAWAAKNGSRPIWKRPLAWIAVAASLAVISSGIALSACAGARDHKGFVLDPTLVDAIQPPAGDRVVGTRPGNRDDPVALDEAHDRVALQGFDGSHRKRCRESLEGIRVAKVHCATELTDQLIRQARRIHHVIAEDDDVVLQPLRPDHLLDRWREFACLWSGNLVGPAAAP